MRPAFQTVATVLGVLHRFRRDESASYLILTALTMPALMGIVGLGSEVGLWYYTHQHMQSAADSGAISAATAYYVQGNSTGLATQAEATTANYGFVAGVNNVTVTVNEPPLSGTHTSTSNAVEVIVTQPQDRLFSKLFSSNDLTISARAVAVASGGIGCVLSLDSTASGATVIKGTSAVNLTGCSLMDNSNSSSALTLNGGGTLSALSVNVVGGISGASGITTTQGINTGTGPAADPYANSSYSSFSGCDKHNFSSKKTETISPGVYCGGITLNAGA
jgi:Flp pilus assembly protein TadG